MLKVNRKVEYALMALKFMVEKKTSELTTAREICDKFNMPFDTLAKVMQAMNSKGILKSVKGVNGGYSLEKKLCQVSYLELVQVIEGKNRHRLCQSPDSCKLTDCCNIRGPMQKLRTKVNVELGKTTLKELLLDD